MQKFTVTSLGCKVNQYESRQIAQFLSDHGLFEVGLSDRPDLTVVHTCCVTHIASGKSRQLLRKALRSNPDCVVVASGCLATLDNDEIADLKERIHIISNKDEIASHLADIIKESSTKPSNTTPIISKSFISKTSIADKIKDKKGCVADCGLSNLRDYPGHSRAFLKIQDGCDGFCSYCIIPRTRSRVYSKDISSVVKEASDLVMSGFKEIVLTGIFLGAYGHETVRRKRWGAGSVDNLSMVLKELVKIEGLERIRLSSLEPGDVTDELLEVIAGEDKIVNHLHLPLQSGSPSILRKMCRQYGLVGFMEMVERVKSALDRPAITTDVIVGFPGESEEDFGASCRISREVGFSKIHVFSFSEREGTAASRMEPKVGAGEIHRRGQILQEISDEMGIEFARSFAGEKVGIIVENKKPVIGRCERYFEVELAGCGTVEKGELVYGVLRDDGRIADVVF